VRFEALGGLWRGHGRVQVMPMAQIRSRAHGRADLVLLDVPCSNTGVLRRRVDLRWRIRPEEIDRLRNTQLQLLRQAATLLKTGGTLVYSTCSLEPEENGELIELFLRENPEFTNDGVMELLPWEAGADGAFSAILSAHTSA